MEAGVPGEAQAIVEKGIENGTLKSDDKTEQGRYDRLLAAAKKQADADRARSHSWRRKPRRRRKVRPTSAWVRPT